MIYANYAATTPALSKAVIEQIRIYLEGVHLNAGRNFEGLQAGAIALRARRAVAKLFNAGDPLRVILTSGATASMNMAINGLVRQGCHVLATSIEHNAVARPLHALHQNKVIELQWLKCNSDGSLDPQEVRRAIKKNTRLLVMSHASNVLGTILPVEECMKIAREHDIMTIVDTAQTAGVLPWTTGDLCDVIVFTGHKGLGALAGTGGFVLNERAAGEMRPWAMGGTGSASHSLDMPDFLPDKFEPGTGNSLGMLSLATSVEEILLAGIENKRAKDISCTEHFMAGLANIKNVTAYGVSEPTRRVALVSIAVHGYDAADVSKRLFEKHGIVTRSGLHCSPLAHKTAGTFPGGTVRFSFGGGTTEAQIDTMLEAVAELDI
ncbi:MAG: aminotransferase class V-fold PLP-dependent enzyme [Spirochaetes bacterium]|nr:aminotransferase class V-fold PLP-dependent enzyme [Spirochaetota bacterium]